MQAAHVFANAERYDRHSGRLAARLYDKVVADAAASGLPDGARVLDAGTGPGRIPRDLAMVRPAWTVDAVDLEPRMIDFARRQDTKGRVTFAVGDVAALPYPDETFDLIVSSISQHHWGDVEGGIRDLRRVLRPGGRLWIYDARWALRRALRAAEKTFDSVRKEPVAIGHWPLSMLVSRLSARA